MLQAALAQEVVAVVALGTVWFVGMAYAGFASPNLLEGYTGKSQKLSPKGPPVCACPPKAVQWGGRCSGSTWALLVVRAFMGSASG